ncbi:phage shock protein A (PspA) family protein [Pseudomonas cuatrocienegasensis]|uniref:Phage shock protein A (PspA) family protein n=1 Tax=Pseudomonas cuatrocienegasensis TaxID=543360 RepID=A0ABY1BRN0_9PSED|nr:MULTISPECIES: PspA/IM30 family protein [Pseudomonas]OEC32612.1 phage shock protein A [Pseudomonas sp. 21C1]SER46482.1 phage shock protein A (PspA) family protein [Pseudomonas cuatrocienegasensis]
MDNSQSIWGKLLTALRGKSTEIGEAIVDKQALTILDQEIRDADGAIRSAQHDLAGLMGKEKLGAKELDELKSTITDLESRALAALNAQREDLAHEVAARIGELEGQLKVKTEAHSQLQAGIARMRQDIAKAQGRINGLRTQVDMAKARDTVQKAQVSASVASGQANGKLETAVASLNRLQKLQDERAATMAAHEELAAQESGSDLDRRLREANIIPDENSANSVLARLKATKTE